jgi:hypothetical protein
MNQRTINLVAKSVLNLPLFAKNRVYIPWVPIAIINWHPIKNSKRAILDLYPDYSDIFGSVPEYRQEIRHGNLAIFYYNPEFKSDLGLLISKLFETSRRFKKIYLISRDSVSHGLDNVYWIRLTNQNALMDQNSPMDQYSLFFQ